MAGMFCKKLMYRVIGAHVNTWASLPKLLYLDCNCNKNEIVI